MRFFFIWEINICYVTCSKSSAFYLENKYQHNLRYIIKVIIVKYQVRYQIAHIFPKIFKTVKQTNILSSSSYLSYDFKKIYNIVIQSHSRFRKAFFHLYKLLKAEDFTYLKNNFWRNDFFCFPYILETFSSNLFCVFISFHNSDHLPFMPSCPE